MLNAFFESERFTGTAISSSVPNFHFFAFDLSLWLRESKFPSETLGKFRSLSTVARQSVRLADARSLPSRVEPAPCLSVVDMT